MEKLTDKSEEAAHIFYQKVLDKLNTTLEVYQEHLPEIYYCREYFEALEQAAFSHDTQINHLLSITVCLLKYVPNSPLIEQIFTNFLKDYLYLVDPSRHYFTGDLYLSPRLVQEQQHTSPAKSRGTAYSALKF